MSAEKFKTMKGALLHYKTKDGLNLVGFLVKSKKANKKVILHIFGMSGNFFQSDRYAALSEKTEKSNFDLFFAGNRGMGLLTPFTLKKKKAIIGTAKEKFKDCVFDISASINLLSRLGYTEIFLAGHSTGCQKIVYYNYIKKDRRVKGLILLAPADDYNIAVKEFGKKFKKAVSIAENMIKHKKGDEITPKWISLYTAKRFLSYADPKNVESRIFNYDSKLKEFSSIKCPVLAVFGDNDQYLVKPAKQYMKILEKRTSSRKFSWIILDGADHSFSGMEKQLAAVMLDWLKLLT
jgi:pimeloyl-ACP methyl ester carboxylesterase